VKTNLQAFVEKFSRDLAAEVSSSGITIQTVHPGYVATNMASFMKPSLLSPDPDTFAAATIRTLGLEQRTAGFWTHKIQVIYFPFVFKSTSCLFKLILTLIDTSTVILH
jgi:17beta-estradiol 17-dehydrogenase / very-long-chain 3-oxoacyl-CoA reductase